MGYILLEVTINPILEPTDPKAWSPQAKQTMGRKCNSTHQQIIGLKFNCPLEQDPIFPTASASHLEAYTSLLASSTRGQTEKEPQSCSIYNENYITES